MLDLLIVTGATRGIGNAIATTSIPLARKILAIGTTEINTITHLSSTWINLKLNLGDLNSIKLSIQKSLDDRKYNNIGVILCASQLGSPGGIFEANIEDWEDLYRVNVLGNLLVLQTCVAMMGKNGSLRSIFFAGGGAAYGYPEFSGYSLTKVATVRAVENIGKEFEAKGLDASIIALAPGAVATQMLEKVIANGGTVKTKTDINESVTFATRFLLDQIPSSKMNGRFIHVRDNLEIFNLNILGNEHFKLRRIE